MNESNETKKGMQRRDALKGAAVAGLGMATGAIGAPESAKSGQAKRNLIREENAKPGTRDWLLTKTRTPPRKDQQHPEQRALPVDRRLLLGEQRAGLYDGPKDKVVFNAATIWWAKGLSSPPGHVNPIRHGVAQQGPDERVQQITDNLSQRMIF